MLNKCALTINELSEKKKPKHKMIACPLLLPAREGGVWIDECKAKTNSHIWMGDYGDLFFNITCNNNVQPLFY